MSCDTSPYVLEVIANGIFSFFLHHGDSKQRAGGKLCLCEITQFPYNQWKMSNTILPN